MKKAFTLAVSIFLSSSIFAAAEFFIKVNSNGNYTVSLNNQTISSPSGIFRFFDLYPGNYSLKVFENGYNGRCIFDKPVFIADGYRTVAEVDPYRGIQIIDKLPFIQRSWYIDNILSNPIVYSFPVPPCPAPPRNGPGWNNGHQNGDDDDHHHSNNHPPVNYPGSGYYGNGNLLDDAGMQSLLQTMKNATFEENMLQVAKTAIKNRQVKTNQVHQMLNLFVFEKNKLELAKFCYDKTLDRNNYYTLYNDFTFSSYTSELDKYINSH